MQVEQMEVKNIYIVGFGLTSIKFRVKFSTGENDEMFMAGRAKYPERVPVTCKTTCRVDT